MRQISRSSRSKCSWGLKSQRPQDLDDDENPCCQEKRPQDEREVAVLKLTCAAEKKRSLFKLGSPLVLWFHTAARTVVQSAMAPNPTGAVTIVIKELACHSAFSVGVGKMNSHATQWTSPNTTLDITVP